MLAHGRDHPNCPTSRLKQPRRNLSASLQIFEVPSSKGRVMTAPAISPSNLAAEAEPLIVLAPVDFDDGLDVHFEVGAGVRLYDVAEPVDFLLRHGLPPADFSNDPVECDL